MTAVAAAERWQRVKEVLADALDRDTERRDALLGEVRSSDPDLAREVESLLGWCRGYGGMWSGPIETERPAGPVEGDRLGPYEVAELLGSGGMGAVYRALDTRLGRAVAVKVLASQVTDDVSALRRFEREARTVASLSHPNILSIFDYGREGTMAYAVTELLQGESLRSRLRAGPLPLPETLRIARQIASGLATAHGKGIVHRDIKPENVFLCSDGTAKILDFGLAKQAWPLAVSAGDSSLQTRAGLLMGTVGYMAPEQVRGEDVDARADVFAFGVLLHEMLTGRRPFDRGTPAETLAAVLRDGLPPSDPARVPPHLARVLGQCLAKERGNRFASAREALQAIEAVRAPRSSLRSRETTRRAVAVAALAAALAPVGWFGRPAETPPHPPDLTIRVGRHPDALAFEGGHVWVSNNGSNSVTRIRARDGVVTGTFAVGEAPHALTWDGRNVWVANHRWLDGDHSTLMKLDPADGHVVMTIRLPGQPIHLATDGTYIWVCETWPSYELRKIRAADGALLSAFTAGGTPRQSTTDGENVWVSNGPVRWISRLRASDGKVLRSTAVEGGGPALLSRAGPYLWVGNNDSDWRAMTTLKVRADDLQVVGRFATPNALAQAASERWLFTCESGRVVQRRALDGRVVASWAGPVKPGALAFDGYNLWATDYDNASVTMISGRNLAAADPS